MGLGLVIAILTLELVYRLVALPPDYRHDRHEAALPATAVVVAERQPATDVRLDRRLDPPPLAAPPRQPDALALAPGDEPAGLRLNRVVDRPPGRSAVLVGGAPASGGAVPAGDEMAAGLDAGAEPDRPPAPSPETAAAGLAVPALPPRPARRQDGSGPLVAIIIDDMGYSPVALGRLAAMPGPLTLAFLPDAEGTPGMLEIAARRGFELMLHLPMEPLGDADPGAEALLVGLDEAELRRRVRWAIAQVPGAIGVNNHMGSRFTADARGLEILMDELRQRGLYFLDSRTNPLSIAERVALAAGIPATGRDIFIDHDPSPAFIAGQLAAIERIARANGDVIAIGHPYSSTLNALEAWLPTLAGRGFRLARSSEVLARRLCARALSGAEPCGPALHLIGYAAEDEAAADLEPVEAAP